MESSLQHEIDEYCDERMLAHLKQIGFIYKAEMLEDEVSTMKMPVLLNEDS